MRTRFALLFALAFLTFGCKAEQYATETRRIFEGVLTE